MTEKHTPPAPVEETATVVEKTHPSKIPTRRRGSSLLGGVAILLVIALSAGLYYYGQQQFRQQQSVNQALQEQLVALQQRQTQEKQQLETLLQQQGKALEASGQQQDSLTRQLNELQEKVVAISGNDAKIWLLAQADFLVKMAGRKLWADQDLTSAATLLKSADVSLTDMHDPSLIDVRRAINEDIAILAKINQVDFDGIILKLNQLSNQVDNLRLADNNKDDSPMDENSRELSSSLSEWRQNLSKSWHNFINDFITLRRRDSSAEPLLAPNQDVYLRENIRSRLLVAAQAVPRHQDEVYHQSLETISAWVRAYFDATDPGRKAFLEELDNLNQQSISINVPTQLKSLPMLEKLMQTRVRNLLARTPAIHE